MCRRGACSYCLLIIPVFAYFCKFKIPNEPSYVHYIPLFLDPPSLVLIMCWMPPSQFIFCFLSWFFVCPSPLLSSPACVYEPDSNVAAICVWLHVWMCACSCRASGGWEADNDLSTYITVQSFQGVQMWCRKLANITQCAETCIYTLGCWVH